MLVSYKINRDDTLKELNHRYNFNQYELSDVDYGIRQLNGVVARIQNGQYEKGYRNNLAVDFCIGCWLTCCDPNFIRYALENNRFIDRNQSDNLANRIKIIQDYEDHWMNDRHSPINFMIDPEENITWAEQNEYHILTSNE